MHFLNVNDNITIILIKNLSYNLVMIRVIALIIIATKKIYIGIYRFKI